VGGGHFYPVLSWTGSGRMVSEPQTNTTKSHEGERLPIQGANNSRKFVGQRDGKEKQHEEKWNPLLILAESGREQSLLGDQQQKESPLSQQSLPMYSVWRKNSSDIPRSASLLEGCGGSEGGGEPSEPLGTTNRGIKTSA